MKRFADYEEEEEEGMQFAPKASAVKSSPLPPPPRSAALKAREVHLDVETFERAARGEVNSLQTASSSSKRRTPIVNVGLAQDHGIWAPETGQAQEEEEQVVKAYKKPTAKPQEPQLAAVPVSLLVTRHGTKLADYQGRTFVDARRWPKPLLYTNGEDGEDDEEDGDHSMDAQVQAYLGLSSSKRTKRQSSKLPAATASPPTREFLGHTMGVSKLRVFGCLALTAGMDGSCMIWDTSLQSDVTNATTVGLADDRGAIQSYFGHDGKAVRDCGFPAQHAQRFASAGLDGFVNLWDTETGQLLCRFHDPNHPHLAGVNAVEFKPDDEFQLVGACSDRRLRHWDIRIGGNKPQQTYDFHQSAVNTAMFCERGRKFVSTGDDRKMAIWDWGVPSPVKIISEVSLPSIPATALHPSTLSFVGVGLDNRLFQFKINAHTGVVKRAGDCTVEGFHVSGSCEPGYSHCGRAPARWRIKSPPPTRTTLP
ncbi:hypothetical protein BASA81_002529 [Batrachochytrium salamandrivorans]|nr:hypothetical protein BASA81_002529 [Batrachochytrium salamandrivorans]